MKGRRFPYRLRADGEVKGTFITRTPIYLLCEDAPFRPFASADRTVSPRSRAGSRRRRRCA